jgi:hypothetical protein
MRDPFRPCIGRRGGLLPQNQSKCTRHVVKIVVLHTTAKY